MTWINFLHLYQPANADPYVVEEATEASYKRIVKLLEDNSDLRFTLNITGCLILRWQELGYDELIGRIKKLVHKGQLELTGSVAYHCLTPLVPLEETRSQIKENTRILRESFGDGVALEGFFMPEMAYSKEVAQLVREEGFSWLILDEIAYNEDLEKTDYSGVYEDKSSGLKVILRSRSSSNTYVPELVQSRLRSSKTSTSTLITATDGELYGLRHEDPQGVLEKVVSEPGLSTQTVSDHIASLESIDRVILNPCNWESSPEELAAGEPYASWLSQDNPLQKDLWDLAYMVYDAVETNHQDENYTWARWHLVRGLASCTFWWASAKDFSYIYGPHAWCPDEVERGVNELVRAIRSLEDPSTRSLKIKAEKQYIKIKNYLWHRHWEYYWKPDKT